MQVKDVYKEPRQGGDGEFDKVMTKFYGSVKTSKIQGRGGALLLAVCRGKVSLSVCVCVYTYIHIYIVK
jgi:hypothetical protein